MRILLAATLLPLVLHSDRPLDLHLRPSLMTEEIKHTPSEARGELGSAGSTNGLAFNNAVRRVINPSIGNQASIKWQASAKKAFLGLHIRF
jgi:hypothetical protein